MRTSSILRSLFFVFALLACFCHFSNASDADDDEAEVIAPNEQILKSSDSGKVEAVNDISVSATFPNNPFKTVPAGETLELLVTFGNLNKTVDYTVKALTGFFTDPKNASLVLRNLTAYRYNNVVPANDKVNLTYPIMPDYEMLPQDVGLIVLIHYVDKTEQLYRAVGYNGVIKVAEPRTTFDLQDKPYSHLPSFLPAANPDLPLSQSQKLLPVLPLLLPTPTQVTMKIGYPLIICNLAKIKAKNLPREEGKESKLRCKLTLLLEVCS
ncbi:hypothetical protein BKA69DRAFT_588484 [Paraphysoderma sedebokerense]|nr:hypothetical protein BKA69DRAFT_588484 [Paraphysoderma sedebokerense]